MSELMRLTYTYDGDTLGATRTVNGQPEQVKLRLFINAEVRPDRRPAETSPTFCRRPP